MRELLNKNKCNPLKIRSRFICFFHYLLKMNNIVIKKDNTSICSECYKLLIAPQELYSPFTNALYFVASLIFSMLSLQVQNIFLFVFGFLCFFAFPRIIKSFIYSFYDWLPFDLDVFDITVLHKVTAEDRMIKERLYALGLSISFLIVVNISIIYILLILMIVQTAISFKAKRYSGFIICVLSSLCLLSLLIFSEKFNQLICQFIILVLVFVQVYSILCMTYIDRRHQKACEPLLKS